MTTAPTENDGPQLRQEPASSRIASPSNGRKRHIERPPRHVAVLEDCNLTSGANSNTTKSLDLGQTPT